MDIIGFILIFLLLWIVVMILMAIFAVFCIIFSAISAYKSKRFLSFRLYSDYKIAKGTNITALVFFILTCLNSVGTLLTLTAFIAIIADGSLPRDAIFNPTTVFVMVCTALLALALALGIRCFVCYSRADKLKRQLSSAVFFPKAAQSFKVCPYCGSANDIVNNFCVRCGQLIR